VNVWYKTLVALTVSSTSARIGLVAFSLICATVLFVVVDVKASTRAPALEVWLLIQILALAGTALGWPRFRGRCGVYDFLLFHS